MSSGNLQKYHNQNPLQQWLIRRFLTTVAALIAPLTVETVLDVGCAEGFVAQGLLTHFPQMQVTGVDLDRLALAFGRQHHPELRLYPANALRLPFADNTFDLVICTEVLEHLDEPSVALLELKRVSRRYCLLSVPRFPFFQAANFARGKNLSRWGEDADHRHQWTRRAFQRFASEYMVVTTIHTPFPWQVALCSAT